MAKYSEVVLRRLSKEGSYRVSERLRVKPARMCDIPPRVMKMVHQESQVNQVEEEPGQACKNLAKTHERRGKQTDHLFVLVVLF